MYTDMDDFMGAFFGGSTGMAGRSSGGRSGRGGRAPQKVTQMLEVTLADLYNGKKVDVTRNRTILCETCGGAGRKNTMKNRAPPACPLCRGSGYRITVRQMGMMMQQMQSVCEGCQGSGVRTDPKDICTACAGRKTAQTTSTVTVVVEKGMTDNTVISFPGMGDEEPGYSRCGDFAVVLNVPRHPLFIRHDCDLFISQRISLSEALCGFQFKLTHLDGRELVVRQPRGNITKPGDLRRVVGEGMPIQSQPNKFGDLIVNFEVVYPDRIDEAQLKLLSSALPPPETGRSDNVPTDKDEIVYVSRESMEVLEREIEKDTDSEEEDERQQAPGCSAQ